RSELLGQRRRETHPVAEVAVQDRLGDAGLGRDHVHAHPGPVAANGAYRGLEQLDPPAGAAQRSIFGAMLAPVAHPRRRHVTHGNVTDGNSQTGTVPAVCRRWPLLMVLMALGAACAADSKPAATASSGSGVVSTTTTLSPTTPTVDLYAA